MKRRVSVSIIIPSQGERVALLEQFTALSTQTVWPTEVVVIDTVPSSDELLRPQFESLFFGQVSLRVIEASGAFPGAARNRGVELSASEIVGFLDTKTIPDPAWLEQTRGLLQRTNSDGVIGSCRFVGGTFFSWLLIDGLFGRGPVNTFPGSLFKRAAFYKVGLMLERVRAGEDNEWFQRAALIYVDFYKGPGRSLCEYRGFKDLGFSEFVNKWNRNYLSAARLPQYKLIYEFNIIVWFLVLFGLALNWNSIFADWNTSSPLYFPHVTKIVLGFSVAGYLFLRAIYLPVRRGTPLANVLSYRLPFIFAVVLTADLIKARAFLSRFIVKGR